MATKLPTTLPEPDTDDGPEGVGWTDDEWYVHLDVDGWVTVGTVDAGIVSDPTKLAHALLAADARRKP